ncbi:MAG: DUF1993 domain-containing protein, partial [Methylobacteriaceae bacterium]|nr:DUF1993 domain-containing protein [Methylobacteriaceae bacterium]
MSLSVHEVTVGVFVARLQALAKVLAKAEAHALARKIDPAVLLATRLYPDMFALARQVQLASDFAKGCVARLAGVEIPKYEDTESTFAELQARIAKTIAFVQTITPAQLEGADDRMLDLTIARQPARLSGRDYLLHQATPNFYFHVTTAYAILRHCGVE